nr:hypothetical protein [Clostridium sp. AM22-16AC]
MGIGFFFSPESVQTAFSGISQECPFFTAPEISPCLHICWTLRTVIPIAFAASMLDK